MYIVHLRAMRGIPGVEAAPVAGEDMPVDTLVRGNEPALDRARVDVRREAERRIARLAPPDPIRVRSPWNHVRPSLSLVQIEFMNVRVASMR
jgi:hypothetical protein